MTSMAKSCVSLEDIRSLDSSEPKVRSQKIVALLPWGDLFEDFFDTIGISFETFRDEHMGSYMFGYINALKTVGIKTVIFFVSARITETIKFIHKPTGAQVCIIPASRPYRFHYNLRRRALSAFGIKEGQKFNDIYSAEKVRSSFLVRAKNTLKSLGSYLSIPWKAFAEELKAEGCNAILCQEYEHARFDVCVLLGKLLHLPVFATFQGGDSPQSGIEVLSRYFAIHSCEGLIIPTKTEAERVQSAYRVSSSKITRIFNPVDLNVWQAGDRNTARQALGIPEQTKIVVYHGRIEIERKGLDVLLEAWERVCTQRTGQDLRLLLVGTGSDSHKLREQIAQLQLPGVIWIDEFVRDRTIVQQYLAAADLYTLPSRHEGFPVAPLEAMACGLPVVAADAPGVPDIFENGEHSGGIVVRRGDVNALAQAIGNVLDNASLRQNLAQCARQRLEGVFSMEAVGQQLKTCLFSGSN